MRKNKRILMCSEGNGSNGGIYDHELDAMRRYAPRLARATKVFTKDLSQERTDFADIVVIVNGRHNYDCVIPFDVIVEAGRIHKKGGVDIFFVTAYADQEKREKRYHVWELGSHRIQYVAPIRTVFYDFERCGGKIRKNRGFDDNDGHTSIDWCMIQKLVCKNNTL